MKNRKNYAVMGLAFLAGSIFIVGLIFNKHSTGSELNPSKEPRLAISAKPRGDIENKNKLAELLLNNELEDHTAPLWGVSIEPVDPGDHKYFYLVGGKPIADPMNPFMVKGTTLKQSKYNVSDFANQLSVFRSPLITYVKNPIQHTSGNLLFVYEGNLTLPAFFLADCTGGILAPEEFQPLNKLARANLELIHENETLGGIRGRVINEHDQPLAGARVNCLVGKESENPITIPLFSKKTNENGEFYFRGLPPDFFRIVAVADGYQASAEQMGEIIAGQISDDYELVLEAAGSITGIVYDPMGNPIPGAAVFAEGKQSGWQLVNLNIEGFQEDILLRSDQEGRFALTGLPPGVHQISAIAKGYGPATHKGVAVVKGGPPAEVRLHLTFCEGLTGRVVQEINGEIIGIEKAKVNAYIKAPSIEIENLESYSSLIAYNTYTGSDGSFDISDLPSDTELILQADKDGRYRRHAIANRITTVLKAGKQHEPIIFQLPGIMELHGQVHDAGGMPIEGAKLIANSLNRTDSSTAESDRHGNFRLSDLLSNGKYTLQASASGFITQSAIDIDFNQKDDLHITLKRGIVLTGNVIHGETAEPVPQVHLTFRSDEPSYISQVESAADGSFEVTNLTEAMYRLDAICQGPNALNMIVEQIDGIEVVRGKTNELTVLVWPASSIKGRVLKLESTDNKGIANATVAFRSIEGDNKLHNFGLQRKLNRGGRTNNNGEFAIERLFYGEYELVFYLPDELNPGEDPFSFKERIQVVDLDVGEVMENVQLFLRERKGGIIRGIVTDMAGHPKAEIEVAAHVRYPLREHLHDINNGQKQVSDKEGRFEISGLTLGEEFLIRARDEKITVGESEYVLLTRNDPDADLIIRLKPSFSFSGCVVDSDSQPIPQTEVNLLSIKSGMHQSHPIQTAFTNYNGEFEIVSSFAHENLKEIRARIIAVKEGYRMGKSGILDIDPTLDYSGIELTLKKADQKILFGIVVDQYGTPLPNCDITLTTREKGEQYSQSFRTKTNGQGEFQIAKANDENKLLLKKNGSLFATGWFPNPEDRISFIIMLGKGVTGRVIDAETGAPVNTFSIQMKDSSHNNRKKPLGTECVLIRHDIPREDYLYSDNGYFQVLNVNKGAYQLKITGPGIASKTIKKIVIPACEEFFLGDIKVHSGATLTGRFIQEETNKPFPLRQWGTVQDVLIASALFESGEKLDVQLEYDEQAGNFTIKRFPISGKSLLISLNNSIFLNEVNLPELSPEYENAIGDIALKASMYLKGRFVDVDYGLPYIEPINTGSSCYLFNDQGAVLKAHHTQFSIGGGGLFWLNSVPLNTTKLKIYPSHRLPVEIPIVNMPNKEMEVNLGDIPLEKGITVRGHVIAANGELAKGVPVSIVSLNHFYHPIGNNESGLPYKASTTSNETGEFVISGILPGPLKIIADGRPFAWAAELDSPILTINESALAGQDLYLDLQF